MNQAEPTLMEMITYGGAEQQVVQIEDISEAGTCGEPELLYHLLNRHGEVKQVCGWEIALDRKEALNAL